MSVCLWWTHFFLFHIYIYSFRYVRGRIQSTVYVYINNFIIIIVMILMLHCTLYCFETHTQSSIGSDDWNRTMSDERQIVSRQKVFARNEHALTDRFMVMMLACSFWYHFALFGSKVHDRMIHRRTYKKKERFSLQKHRIWIFIDLAAVWDIAYEYVWWKKERDETQRVISMAKNIRIIHVADCVTAEWTLAGTKRQTILIFLIYKFHNIYIYIYSIHFSLSAFICIFYILLFSPWFNDALFHGHDVATCIYLYMCMRILIL